MAIQGGAVAPMDPYTQTLASLTQQPRKNLAGDGISPTQSPAVQEDQQPDGLPTLLDASDSDAYRTIDSLAKSQDRLRKNRWNIDLYHGWLDSNIQFGRLDKIPNQNVWTARMAPGVNVERAAAVPNKASDLCTKVTDALLADPPKPNPTSRTDDESADQAAEMASQILRLIHGESGINEIQHYRWALRNGLTRSTSWLEFDVDDCGGGYQPFQVLADPEAPGPYDPENENATMGHPDPETGSFIPCVSPTRRYVSADNQFVEEAAQADRVWLPGLVVRRHQRCKVLTFPPTASIEEADALLLTDWCSLSEARTRWPETVGTMGMSELLALTQWKPTYHEMIVPFGFRVGLADGATGPSLEDVGGLSPLLQRRMFFHRFIVNPSKEYKDGLHIDISGANGGLRLDQQTLDYTVTLPVGGQTTRCRDIPFVQVTPEQDVSDMDPTGYPFEGRFDGSAQADATLIAGYLDALDRMAHPHVFIRSLTAVTEDEWFDRSVPITIGQGDQPPFYEQFSPLPPVVPISEHLQIRQDTASGLTATAQGLDSENAQSGIAKKLTVRQSQISLAGIQQQLHAAMTRGWRIESQWIQARFKVSQLLQASGEASSEEETWWTGQDFAGLDEIGIEPGTGTFMTAEDKANYIAFLQGQRWIDAEKAAEIGVTGIARDLGLPADYEVAAIERSVATWMKGIPYPEWIQEWQQYEQAQQAYSQEQAMYQQANQVWQQGAQSQAVVDAGPPQPLGPEAQNAQAGDQFAQANLFLMMHPFDAMNPPQAPQTPPPVMPWTPFEARPSDTEPEVASKYMKRLRHLQFTPTYAKQPREWRAAADQMYTKCRQALATATGAAPQNPGAGQPHQAPQTPAKMPTAITQPQAA